MSLFTFILVAFVVCFVYIYFCSVVRIFLFTFLTFFYADVCCYVMQYAALFIFLMLSDFTLIFDWAPRLTFWAQIRYAAIKTAKVISLLSGLMANISSRAQSNCRW